MVFIQEFLARKGKKLEAVSLKMAVVTEKPAYSHVRAMISMNSWV